MKLLLIVLFNSILLSASTNSFHHSKDPDGSLKIVIIRHGEKPSVGDNLCPKGLNRAMLLPPVLHKVAGIPAHIFIPRINTGKSTGSIRMLQTVTPFAVEYNLTINSSFDKMDVKAAAKEILKKSGTVLVVWEHSNIPDLAKALGVKGNLKWKDDDFGSIWIIEFKNNSSAPGMRIEQENLDPKGSCN